MLSVLRQNANSWFMILLFAIITIVFVFTFGSWGGGDVSGDLPMAATINGRVISQAQYNALYGTTFDNMRRYRPGYGVEDARKDKLKESVLDRLVGVELLAQEAEARDIFISDEEVVEEIKRQYFGTTEFSQESYKRIVNGLFQTNEARFEDQIRRQLMGRRLEQLLRESQQVSPTEVRAAFNERNNRVELNVLRIDAAYFAKVLPKPTDDEVSTWAAAHGGKVEGYYNERMNTFRHEKQVKLRQILVRAGGDQDEAALAKAKTKLESAQKRLAAGEAFDVVAKAMSEDGKGGELDFVEKSEMLGDELATAAFSLPQGGVSNIVKSPQGLHIIRVEEIKEAFTESLDEVRTKIALKLLRDERGDKFARAQAEKALEALRGGTEPEALKIEMFDGAITEFNEDLTAPRVQATGWFNDKANFVPRIGPSPEVVKAAFALTEENPVGPKVFEVGGRLYLFKLKAREEPDEEKFAEAREAIESGLIAARSQRVIDAFIEELRENATIIPNEKVLSYGS